MKKQNELEVSEKKEIMVGIVRPISSSGSYTFEHWSNIQKVIDGALYSDEKYSFKVSLVSDGDKAEIIQNTIIKNLYHSDVVICDLSSQNPNVFFELGVRMTFRKPCILIIDNETKAPFDISSIKYIKYPRSLHKYDLENELEIPLRRMVISSYEDYISNNIVSFAPLFTEIKLEQNEVGLDSKELNKIDLIYEMLASYQNREMLFREGVNELRIHAINKMKEYVSDNLDSFIENNYTREDIVDELVHNVLRQLHKDNKYEAYPAVPFSSIQKDIDELVSYVINEQNISKYKNYTIIE